MLSFVLQVGSKTMCSNKIATFVDHNICTHLDRFVKEYVNEMNREPHISYSRPPDPQAKTGEK